MGELQNHENEQLANRLTAAADGIVNHAAVGLERDLRDAAEHIRESDRPMVLITPAGQRSCQDRQHHHRRRHAAAAASSHRGGAIDEPRREHHARVIGSAAVQ